MKAGDIVGIHSRLRQPLCVQGCRDLPDNLGEVFPMDLVTPTPHVKNPPRKKSVGDDEWQRPILLEQDKKKRVRYCQRRQDFLRIPREYLTSHYSRKKSRSICLSVKACGTAGRSGYFRQCGATCHVTEDSMVMIQNFFDDRVIYTLRPSIITRLSISWFLIVGILSGRSVPQKKKLTTDVLKEEITKEITSIEHDTKTHIIEHATPHAHLPGGGWSLLPSHDLLPIFFQYFSV